MSEFMRAKMMHEMMFCRGDSIVRFILEPPPSGNCGQREISVKKIYSTRPLVLDAILEALQELIRYGFTDGQQGSSTKRGELNLQFAPDGVRNGS